MDFRTEIERLVGQLGGAPVVMVSGVSGSGKTTLATALEPFGYVRLSIDVLMWERHGMAGHDYPEEKYPEYLAEAESELLRRLDEIISSGGKAVLDFAFCKRAVRDAYRAFARSHGAGVYLIYCDTPLSVIKERLRRRNLTPGPDAAIVTDEMAERFFAGFQRPDTDEECIVFGGNDEND